MKARNNPLGRLARKGVQNTKAKDPRTQMIWDVMKQPDPALEMAAQMALDGSGLVMKLEGVLLSDKKAACRISFQTFQPSADGEPCQYQNLISALSLSRNMDQGESMRRVMASANRVDSLTRKNDDGTWTSVLEVGDFHFHTVSHAYVWACVTLKGVEWYNQQMGIATDTAPSPPPQGE